MNNLLENLICLAKKALKLITEQLAAATEKPQTDVNKPSTPATAAPVAEVKTPVETTPVVETAPIVAEVSAPVIAKATTDNLPEDSILRRHALAQLKNILEAVKGARPSDSIQSRHYDAEINSLISQALVCKTALANATANYANLTKTTVETSKEEVSVKTAETEAVEPAATEANVPTDSILRRHYEALKNS